MTDIPDYELDRIAESKSQHKQLLQAISKLADVVSKKETNVDLSPLKDHSSVIKALADKVGSISFPKEFPAPNINVDNDNEELCNEIKSLKESVDKMVSNQDRIIELLSIKPSNIKVNRNDVLGTLTGAEIEYKKIN